MDKLSVFNENSHIHRSIVCVKFVETLVSRIAIVYKLGSHYRSECPAHNLIQFNRLTLTIHLDIRYAQLTLWTSVYINGLYKMQKR